MRGGDKYYIYIYILLRLILIDDRQIVWRRRCWQIYIAEILSYIVKKPLKKRVRKNIYIYIFIFASGTHMRMESKRKKKYNTRL